MLRFNMSKKKIALAIVIVTSIILSIMFLILAAKCKDMFCIQVVSHTSSLEHRLLHSTKYKTLFYSLFGVFGVVAFTCTSLLFKKNKVALIVILIHSLYAVAFGIYVNSKNCDGTGIYHSMLTWVCPKNYHYPLSFFISIFVIGAVGAVTSIVFLLMSYKKRIAQQKRA